MGGSITETNRDKVRGCVTLLATEANARMFLIAWMKRIALAGASAFVRAK